MTQELKPTHNNGSSPPRLASACLALTLLFAPHRALAQYPVVHLDYPIVYVRCPRQHEPFVVTGEITVGGERVSRSRTFGVADGPDTMPDVTHYWGTYGGTSFQAQCDLVLLNPDGSEDVLYDCASRPEGETCSAMDPAVSFDGRRVAFTVFHGSVVRARQPIGARRLDENADDPDELVRVEWPNRLLRTTHAQLMVVDVDSRAVAEITAGEPGVYDNAPAWMSTGRIAFTSSRGGVYRTRVAGFGRASQIYTIDPDGENIEVASHHALGGEQHPLQLRDGRLAYSSWQIFGLLAYRKNNGSVGASGTVPNLFHIYAQSPDGAEPFALYGQHLRGVRGQAGHSAAHFLSQAGDGRIWSAEYYRSNNDALGNIIGFMPPPLGQEGYGPGEIEALSDGTPSFYWETWVYRPRDLFTVAPWSVFASDSPSPAAEPPFAHPNYSDPMEQLGKLGYPAAVPEGLLLSWGLGNCNTRTIARQQIPADSSAGRDNPSCDLGVYRLTSDRIPSDSHADLERIADSNEYHELMAKPLVSYMALHGIEQPAVIDRAEVRYRGTPGLERGTPFGLLGASSLIHRETGHFAVDRLGRMTEPGVAFQSHFQLAQRGADLIDYDDSEICGVRILGVMPNRESDRDGNGSRLGERVVILGEVSTAHFDADGARVVDAMGNPDTSFLLRMPANMPYLMQGIDCDGRALNTDQTWQSLRPGERKVCGGCHVHAGEPFAFPGTFASREDFDVPHLGEGSVPLLDGLDDTGQVRVRTVTGHGLSVQYERDVAPILERRCVSCHGATAPAAGLRLDDQDEVIRCLFDDRLQRCVPAERRVPGVHEGANDLDWPNYSRYARFMNARGSLFYWKAANARTDGLSDADRDYDIDFGLAHPTELTREELGILARWLELGGPAGERYLMDTQPPTLNVYGDVVDGALVSFRLGSTDLGSGVDIDSLVVCRVDGADCAWEARPEADPHGVVELDLDAPVADPAVRFRFALRDHAGNERSFVRNVRWFLQLSDAWEGVIPPPPGGDAGGGGGDGGGVDGGPADAGSASERIGSEGGCGCVVSGLSGGGSLAPLMPHLLFWALVWRRRRWASGRRGRSDPTVG